MTRRPMLLGLAGCAAALVVLLLVGGGLTPYGLDMWTSLLTVIGVAQAWNLLAGFSRQFSLGVGAFVGAGSYTAAMVTIHWEWGPIRTVLAGGVVAAVLAAVLAIALLRLREDYFTIGSLAAALALQTFVINSEPLGRSAGLSLPFSVLPTPIGLFQLAAACVFLCSVATVWLKFSAVGLRMSAVGQNEDAAVSLGVGVRGMRLTALMLSGGLMGLLGAVVALQQVAVEPIGGLGITWTIGAIVMTIIGGVGTFFGPVLGGALVYLGLTKQLGGHPILGLVVEGAVLIAVVTLAPRGIWPLLVDLARRGWGRLRPPRQPQPAVSSDDDLVAV
ncbi:branched-chain amino acid ABC transporter permease [Nocardioides sp.]|uniref:branched-chain amino acid ABC transporter permease n=1 Tax=Nocardioides sp. TaxID=35761 RepID=UPI0039E2BE70